MLPARLCTGIGERDAPRAAHTAHLGLHQSLRTISAYETCAEHREHRYRIRPCSALHACSSPTRCASPTQVTSNPVYAQHYIRFRSGSCSSHFTLPAPRHSVEVRLHSVLVGSGCSLTVLRAACGGRCWAFGQPVAPQKGTPAASEQRAAA